MLTYAIVQVTPFCNIDCRYCYLADRTNTRKMTQETFDRVLEFLYRHDGLIDKDSALIWHCGEPLSAGLDFYKKAYERLGRRATNDRFLTTCFSTNATLLDDEWADFLGDLPNLRVRISIDGPQAVHDGNRVKRNGAGTFSQVMDGIQRLQERNIPFDILCVLTALSVGQPDVLWNFFTTLSPRSIGFCVEEVLGENVVSSFLPSNSRDRVQQFFGRFMELQSTSTPHIPVREIDAVSQLLPNLASSKTRFLRDDNVPLKLISIAWNGDVCLFSPELLDLKTTSKSRFILGNVHTHTVQDVLDNPAFSSLYSEIKTGVTLCAESCRYFPVCGGGFPVSKLVENGSFATTETLTCKLRVKAIADAVIQHRQYQAR